MNNIVSFIYSYLVLLTLIGIGIIILSTRVIYRMALNLSIIANEPQKLFKMFVIYLFSSFLSGLLLVPLIIFLFNTEELFAFFIGVMGSAIFNFVAIIKAGNKTAYDMKEVIKKINNLGES